MKLSHSLGSPEYDIVVKNTGFGVRQTTATGHCITIPKYLPPTVSAHGGYANPITFLVSGM